MANPWRFAVSVLSLVIDRLWSNSKRTGVRMACPLCEIKRMLGEDTAFARYHSMLSAVLSLRGVEGRILRHGLSH